MDEHSHDLRGLTFKVRLSGHVEMAVVTFDVDEELGAIFSGCIASGHEVMPDGDCKCGWVGACAAVGDA